MAQEDKNQEIFTCSICGQEFNRRDNLKRHLKTVHKLKLKEVEELASDDHQRRVSEMKPEEAIRMLEQKGYIIAKPQRLADIHKEVSLEPYKGTTYRIGLVGDTHFGSQYQQITALYTAYQYFHDMKIKTVLHSGDLTDGIQVYRGQEFELFLHGSDAQVEYVIANYPKLNGIETWFICGNHDESHWRIAGIDIGAHIAKERKDMKYFGMHGATLKIDGVSIYLHHMTGGVSYARSYKAQKIIEQFAPDQKPNIYLGGGMHCQALLPMYRNVLGYQLPCFQSQTPYLKKKGLYPEVGAAILNFTVDATKAGGISKFVVEFMPYHKHKDKDY